MNTTSSTLSENEGGQAVGTLGRQFERYETAKKRTGSEALAALISEKRVVGDLLKLDYHESAILIHDKLRLEVGGVPHGCFLIATRMKPGEAPDPLSEDTSVILLRVIGTAKLPNEADNEFRRLEAGFRSVASDDTWDAENNADKFTLNKLSHSGLTCRILGTFRSRKNGRDWEVVFGSDISNFYSGRGMKVYKPAEEALKKIVNHTRPRSDDDHPLSGHRVRIGRVRYASSEIEGDKAPEAVEFDMSPTDLIARRTCLFGMSRTGKSNTTKVIASSVFALRAKDPAKGRVGQLIFDVNGEYANENTQDGRQINSSALKNVGQHVENALSDDVVTYGLTPHPNDPGRKIAKINFFGGEPEDWRDREKVEQALEPLYRGKQQVDEMLRGETSRYLTSLRDTDLSPNLDYEGGEPTRYRRLITAYRAILAQAEFDRPSRLRTAYIKGLFNQQLIEALRNSPESTPERQAQYEQAANVFARDSVTWNSLFDAIQGLITFIEDKDSSYADFNRNYRNAPKNRDGRNWDDEKLKGILQLTKHGNGVRLLRRLHESHGADTVGDYAESIVDDLVAGRLVIFDQSTGDPDLNRAAAERIMWALFNRQKRAFINPRRHEDGTLEPPPDVLVYVEEAHNLLPSGSAVDTQNIWSRTAKEGSKYRIGMVYATQEPSSIQANILKNTDNWFVAHLNNVDEVKVVSKFYDFEDFVRPILSVPDAGFLRIRTLSNPYVVPAQVKRFSAVEVA